jgi:hypothetical protein
MIRPKSKKKDVPEQVCYGEDRYPYGLRLSLETPELKKLHKSADSFKIGDVIDITAKGEVINIRKNLSENDDINDECVEMQIVKLDIGSGKTEKENP